MMPLDANTPGARFLNVSAVADGGRIHLTGFYEAAGLIPALVFSVGAPWAANQCLRNICCLWDIADWMRDAEMSKALQTSHCDEHVDLGGLDLMKGNNKAAGRWDVWTVIQPSFVAMLFICLQPFYIWYEIVPIKWEPLSVQWSATWYGQRCYNVLYEGTTVCIHCANAKPDNAEYLFTPNWFNTFQCNWACHEGFVGPNCEISVNAAAAGGSVAAVVGVGALAWFVMMRRYRAIPVKEIIKPEPAINLPPPPTRTVRAEHNMVVFRDNMPVSEIRIKLN